MRQSSACRSHPIQHTKNQKRDASPTPCVHMAPVWTKEEETAAEQTFAFSIQSMGAHDSEINPSRSDVAEKYVVKKTLIHRYSRSHLRRYDRSMTLVTAGSPCPLGWGDHSLVFHTPLSFIAAATCMLTHKYTDTRIKATPRPHFNGDTLSHPFS